MACRDGAAHTPDNALRDAMDCDRPVSGLTSGKLDVQLTTKRTFPCAEVRRTPL